MKMGSHVSTNLKHALFVEPSKNPKNKNPEQRERIGILSFEVANVMSKTIQLHKSLSDREILKLKSEILNSEGVRNLVSSDEAYLLQLAVAEKLDELNRVADVVSRLGKKCLVPALQGFEHVYGDIVNGVIDLKGLGFLVKDMEGMVRKMERYVGSTSSLYGELAVLNELEQAEKKFQNNHHEESRRAFQQKVTWQKQDIKHLKDISIWNQTYDKIVEMLARTVCTIYARICSIFGDSLLGAELGCVGEFREKSGRIESQQYSRMSSIRLRPSNGYNFSRPIERVLKEKKVIHTSPHIASNRGELRIFRPQDVNIACGMGPGRLFMECLSLSSPGSKVDDDEGFSYNDRSSQIPGCCSSVTSSMKREIPSDSVGSTQARSGALVGCDQMQSKCSVLNNSQFGPKSQLALHAPPSTVGGSALALHYANVIIVIEKLLRYPHLVGEDARDDLYQMLPSSLRMCLKNSLKSYIKDLAIYDAPLAHDWKDRLDGILRWLSPLAHNTIRWQSERNFEQQQIVTRINVLLLQTVYFADREKTEAAICELLVGLNYICRYEQQQNALLDCASSFDFEDFMDWQKQY